MDNHYPLKCATKKKLRSHECAEEYLFLLKEVLLTVTKSLHNGDQDCASKLLPHFSASASNCPSAVKGKWPKIFACSVEVRSSSKPQYPHPATAPLTESQFPCPTPCQLSYWCGTDTRSGALPCNPADWAISPSTWCPGVTLSRCGGRSFGEDFHASWFPQRDNSEHGTSNFRPFQLPDLGDLCDLLSQKVVRPKIGCHLGRVVCSLSSPMQAEPHEARLPDDISGVGAQLPSLCFLTVGHMAALVWDWQVCWQAPSVPLTSSIGCACWCP